MKTKFLLISKYVGAVLVIGTLISAVWGIFKVVDSQIDRQNSQDTFQSEIKDVVDGLVIKTDSTNGLLKEQNQRLVEYNKKVEAISKSYLDYIQHDSTLTLGDFKRYMDPFLFGVEKKSSIR